MSPAACTPGRLVRPIGSTSTQPDGSRARPSCSAKGAAWLSSVETKTPPTSSSGPDSKVTRAPAGVAWKAVHPLGADGKTRAAPRRRPRRRRGRSSATRSARRGRPGARRAATAPRNATCRPANSWPWQNGQCAATVPNSSARPGLSGRVSRRPVARTTPRVVTTSSPSSTTKPPVGRAAGRRSRPRTACYGVVAPRAPSGRRPGAPRAGCRRGSGSCACAGPGRCGSCPSRAAGFAGGPVPG